MQQLARSARIFSSPTVLIVTVWSVLLIVVAIGPIDYSNQPSAAVHCDRGDRHFAVRFGAAGRRLVFSGLVRQSRRPAGAADGSAQSRGRHLVLCRHRRHRPDRARPHRPERRQQQRICGAAALCAGPDRSRRDQADAAALYRISAVLLRLRLGRAVSPEGRTDTRMGGRAGAALDPVAGRLRATLCRADADPVRHSSDDCRGACAARAGTAGLAGRTSSLRQDDRAGSGVRHLLQRNLGQPAKLLRADERSGSRAATAVEGPRGRSGHGPRAATGGYRPATFDGRTPGGRASFGFAAFTGLAARAEQSWRRRTAACDEIAR